MQTNSSSAACQWRCAEAAPGFKVVRLTPNWLSPAALPSRLRTRPSTIWRNGSGYPVIESVLSPSISIFGIRGAPVLPYTRSTIVAVPMPMPMHRATRAVPASRRSISSIAVPRIRAPGAPSGWPSAIAPPLTLIFAPSRSKACMNRSTTEANASLTSNRSISPSDMPALRSTFLVTSIGPVSMMAGSEPMLANALIRARGLRPARRPPPALPAGPAPRLRIADQHGGGAIDDTGRIAGVVDVIDGFDFRMGLDGDRIEAAKFAHLDKRRLELRQRLHGGRRPHVLVLGEDRDAVGVFHRDDRPAEASFVPCGCGAALAFHRVGVDVVAGEAVFGGDQVGRDALRQEIGLQRDGGIDQPSASRPPDV